MEFLAAFWKQPFSEDMDALHWGCFILLIMLAVIFWNIILAHILGDL